MKPQRMLDRAPVLFHRRDVVEHAGLSARSAAVDREREECNWVGVPWKAPWKADRCTSAFIGGPRKCADLLQSYFEKHAAEWGFNTAEEHLGAARSFFGSKETASVARGADRLFYRESTNEFGVISGKGYRHLAATA
jgi:hypothetical protein